MKKKTLCGILATTMLFGAFPVSAVAEESVNKLTESLDFREAEEDLSGDGWEWDANHLTLTLENFHYSVPERSLEGKAAIYLPDDSYVEIEGDSNSLETNSYDCHAFYCDGEVNFTGDGEMEIATKSYKSSAFYVKHGPIVFDDELEITVSDGGYIIYLEKAKGQDPVISIQDDAKIIFEEDEFRSRNILVTYGATVEASPNWLDYAETTDDWDEDYIHLVAKDAVKEETSEKDETPADPPAAEAPSAEETPVKQSEYQITIGNAALKKDGYVTYISDAAPYLSHGYTMLPLRALLNVTGADADIAWDAVTKTITVSKDSDTQYNKLVYIVIGEDEIVCPGSENMSVSTPAELKDGRAFVSLRDWMNILSALDMPASDLNWDAKTKTVTFVK